MNPNVTSFQRHFVADVKRCDEMERRVRFLREQLDKDVVASSNGEIEKFVAPPDSYTGPALPLDELEGRLEQVRNMIFFLYFFLFFSHTTTVGGTRNVGIQQQFPNVGAQSQRAG